MSLVGDMIKDVAHKGDIQHEFSVGGLDFVLVPLNTERHIIAEGMISSKKISEKYKAENLLTLNDTVQKYRTLAKVALATKTVNGKTPVDEASGNGDKYKQWEEFRDELMSLSTGMIDRIITEYNKLEQKDRKFYAELEDNVEKS